MLAGSHGIFLSNGPGDPAAVTYAIDNIKEIAKSDVPTFGICLGHQLMGLALGAKTYKLKFGHRGGNHPVKQLESGAIEITSQNHGFAVDPASLPSDASTRADSRTPATSASWAPALAQTAPPTVPGMARPNSSPVRPASPACAFRPAPKA